MLSLDWSLTSVALWINPKYMLIFKIDDSNNKWKI